jgi:DNA-binding transcriptional MocR family regulator
MPRPSRIGRVVTPVDPYSSATGSWCETTAGGQLFRGGDGNWADAALRPELEPDPSTPDLDAARVSIRELVPRVALRDGRTPGIVDLGYAHPLPACTATGALNRIMASLGRKEGERCGFYDLPPGNRALRTEIARQATRAGCRFNRGDIVVTSGCTEAVSLGLRAVCRPGDTVAIESPICFDTLQTLETLTAIPATASCWTRCVSPWIQCRSRPA